MEDISPGQPSINSPISQNNQIINEVPLQKNFSLKNIHLPIWVQVVLIVIGVLIITGILVITVFSKQNKNIIITPTPIITITDEPTSTETELEPTITLIPTSIPTALVTKINTPTPTIKIINPPKYTISYPTELQNVELGQGQSFCITNTPDGGDQTGVIRRHIINDLAWTTYANPFTLCFEPKEGLNRFSLQYKNSANDESEQYTRQFTFHRVANINGVITGQVFEDVNCNGLRDSEESEIKANVNLRFLLMPNNILDGSLTTGIAGAFSYSKAIAETASVDIRIVPDNNSSYQTNPKITYPTVTLNKNSASVQVNIPMVPVANLTACN